MKEYKSVAGEPFTIQSGEAYPLSADENTSILYVVPQGMENLRSRISRMCRPNDKLQTYYKPDDIKKLKASDYDVVLVFPRDKDNISQPLQ